MELINCTPHPICVRLHEEEKVFQPSGVIPRVATVEADAPAIAGIPCVTQSSGDVTGLPDPVEGVVLIVSALVFSASNRIDLVAPDTGKGAVRDEAGRIVAVTRFLRR